MAPGYGAESRRRRRGRSDLLTALLLLPAGLLLIVFLVIPLCATVWLSLSPNPLVHFSGAGLNNYAYLLSKRYYTGVAITTLRLTLETTGAALLFGYPAAMVLADLPPRVAGAVSLAMTLPILAGPLVVVLGWMILLSDGGPLFGPLVQFRHDSATASAGIRGRHRHRRRCISCCPLSCCRLPASCARSPPPLLEAASRPWRVVAGNAS